MEILQILSPILGFVLLRGWTEQKARERADRLKLLEQALANPAIDRATLQELTQSLTGARPPGENGRRAMAVLLAIGWLTLFSGIGVLILGALTHNPDASAAGVLTGLVGFGCVTYPFALRELESRRQPS